PGAGTYPGLGGGNQVDGPEHHVTHRAIHAFEARREIPTASFPSTSWEMPSSSMDFTVHQFADSALLQRNDERVGSRALWLVIDQSQITTIAIAKHARGDGLGNALLKYVKEYAAEQSDFLSLEVSVDNEPAMKLYEKEDFKYGGVRKDYYGPGKDAHVMWVKL